MKMKNIPEISSKNFTFKGRTFIAEASDLRNFRPMRIYDDACDEGFYLVSEKTGKKILFVHSGDNTNDEGEFIACYFSAYCLKENPADLLDLKVVIFND